MTTEGDRVEVVQFVGGGRVRGAHARAIDGVRLTC
jgi:hypothetical protein